MCCQWGIGEASIWLIRAIKSDGGPQVGTGGHPRSCHPHSGHSGHPHSVGHTFKCRHASPVTTLETWHPLMRLDNWDQFWSSALLKGPCEKCILVFIWYSLPPDVSTWDRSLMNVAHNLHRYKAFKETKTKDKFVKMCAVTGSRLVTGETIRHAPPSGVLWENIGSFSNTRSDRCNAQGIRPFTTKRKYVQRNNLSQKILERNITISFCVSTCIWVNFSKGIGKDIKHILYKKKSPKYICQTKKNTHFVFVSSVCFLASATTRYFCVRSQLRFLPRWGIQLDPGPLFVISTTALHSFSRSPHVTLCQKAKHRLWR